MAVAAAGGCTLAAAADWTSAAAAAAGCTSAVAADWASKAAAGCTLAAVDCRFGALGWQPVRWGFGQLLAWTVARPAIGHAAP